MNGGIGGTGNNNDFGGYGGGGAGWFTGGNGGGGGGYSGGGTDGNYPTVQFARRRRWFLQHRRQSVKHSRFPIR
ncbi:MAG: hypothetical protein IPO02_10260 [Bacteroidetes bacterium]|nr:hypothetical protein [Bacteroidota bacterium]